MRTRLCFLLGIAAIAMALPAAALTYVPVSDAALADRAALIAEVTVTATAPYPTVGKSGLPATGYRMQVERSIQGSAPEGPLTVRIPGGMGADGTLVVLSGAPRFAVGDRLLLFLTPRADGGWNLLHLALGAFHVLRTASGAAVVVRNLEGAAALHPERARGDERPRDHDRFVAWLKNRAPRRPAADYFVDLKPGDLRAIHEKFTLLYWGGYNLRWTEFDQGITVPFYAQQAGQSGLPGGAFMEFQEALAAWSNNPGTTIRLSYGGPTAVTGRLDTENGINEIDFGDPFNEFEPFDCSTGGVLAYSLAYAFVGDTATFRGIPFTRIRGSHIVTTKNMECYLHGLRTLDLALAAMSNLLTHELGHSLGLDHSCGDTDSPPCSDDPVLDDAVMRSYIHDDGRGAQLGSDDRAAVQLLYSTDPVPAERCANDAETLCLNGRFAVQVDWRNQFDGSSGKGKAIRNSTATGFFTFGDPSNIELMVKALDFGDFVKIFYGELTDLQFTVVVRDTLRHAVRQYSNTPGDCGGIDQEAFPGGLTKSASQGGCKADKNTLCLLNNRFAVTVDWANPGDGSSGHGFRSGGSGISGMFYFTDPGNIELVTKMINFGDRIAFFYGALSDLPYTIHIRDTASGAEKIYQSTAGKLCGGLDNHAF